MVPLAKRIKTKKLDYSSLFEQPNKTAHVNQLFWLNKFILASLKAEQVDAVSSRAVFIVSAKCMGNGSIFSVVQNFTAPTRYSPSLPSSLRVKLVLIFSTVLGANSVMNQHLLEQGFLPT